LFNEPFNQLAYPWRQPVIANQMARFGPPADPARIKGLTDVAEALARIAAASRRSSSTAARQQFTWMRSCGKAPR